MMEPGSAVSVALTRQVFGSAIENPALARRTRANPCGVVVVLACADGANTEATTTSVPRIGISDENTRRTGGTVGGVRRVVVQRGPPTRFDDGRDRADAPELPTCARLY